MGFTTNNFRRFMTEEAEERAREREANKGCMVRDFSVYCAHCSRWDRLEGRVYTDAANEARRKGWRHVEHHGWVCDHHKEGSL